MEQERADGRNARKEEVVARMNVAIAQTQRDGCAVEP
jgi:hypothetical protein